MQYLVNKNIARLIQEKGIKQRELADRIGVSKNEQHSTAKTQRVCGRSD